MKILTHKTRRAAPAWQDRDALKREWDALAGREGFVAMRVGDPHYDVPFIDVDGCVQAVIDGELTRFGDDVMNVMSMEEWRAATNPARCAQQAEPTATPNRGTRVPRAAGMICDGPQAVAAWLRSLGLKPHEAVKVVPLGNSGAGKSWLCNALLGHNVFKHASQQGSVTAEASFACCYDALEKKAIIVCDVPGLLECNPDNLARNKAAVASVMADDFLPDSPTLCLFVASSRNGRVPDEDVKTVEVIRRYLGASLAPDASAFIVNGIDYDELDESPAEYAAGVKATVRAALGDELAPRHWAFVGKVPRADRNDYASGRTAAVRDTLQRLLGELTPAVVRPAPGTPLQLEGERLRQERDAARKAAKKSDERCKKLQLACTALTVSMCVVAPAAGGARLATTWAARGAFCVATAAAAYAANAAAAT